MGVKGGDKLRRQLARLSEESDKTIQRALRGLAFEIRDGMRDHIARVLKFSGSGTMRYITAFRLKYTFQAGHFRAVIYPLSKAAEVLSRHIDDRARRVTPRDRADLLVKGKIAVPVAPEIKRNSRGRIAARWRPRELLAPNAKGRTKAFLSRDERVIMLRQKGQPAKPAFALEDATTNPVRVDVQKIAEAIIGKRAGAVFGRAIAKAIKESKNA